MTQHTIDFPEYKDRGFIFRDRLHVGKLLAARVNYLAIEEVEAD